LPRNSKSVLSFDIPVPASAKIELTITPRFGVGESLGIHEKIQVKGETHEKVWTLQDINPNDREQIKSLLTEEAYALYSAQMGPEFYQLAKNKATSAVDKGTFHNLILKARPRDPRLSNEGFQPHTELEPPLPGSAEEEHYKRWREY